MVSTYFSYFDNSYFTHSLSLSMRKVSTGKVSTTMQKGEKMMITPSIMSSGSVSSRVSEVRYDLGAYLSASPSSVVRLVSQSVAAPLVVYGYRKDNDAHTGVVSASVNFLSNNSSYFAGNVSETLRYSVMAEPKKDEPVSYYTYYSSGSSNYVYGDHTYTYYNAYDGSLTYYSINNAWVGSLNVTPGVKTLAYNSSTTVTASGSCSDYFISYSFTSSTSAVSVVKTATNKVKVTLNTKLSSPSAVIIRCTAKTASGLTTTGLTSITLQKAPVPVTPMSYYTYYWSGCSYYVPGDHCYTYYNGFNNTLSYYFINMTPVTPKVTSLSLNCPVSSVAYNDTVTFTANAITNNGGPVIYSWASSNSGLVQSSISGNKLTIKNVSSLSADTSWTVTVRAYTPGSTTVSKSSKIVLKAQTTKGVDPVVFNTAYTKISNIFDEAKKNALAALNTMKP